MLLVCDHEISHALRDGVIWIRDPDLERADGRMAGIGGAEHVAEIRIGETHVRDVVQEQRRTAILDERANGFALIRLHPELRLGVGLRRGRIEPQRRAPGRDPAGVAAFIGIAVRPDHAVAKNDEQLVARERFGVQHRGFVAEID